MKTRFKMVAMLGTVLAAGAIAATPLAASASDGDVDAAAWVGHTTSLTPVLLVGGGGTYSFSSDVCAGASSDVDAGLCTISSSGSYTNIVCGTGTVFSATATTTESDGASDTVGIAITFVAGVGVVTGAPSATTVAGVAVLVGTGPGTNGSTCVTGFDVVGAAVLTS
jgi:hypothetical protein